LAAGRELPLPADQAIGMLVQMVATYIMSKCRDGDGDGDGDDDDDDDGDDDDEEEEDGRMIRSFLEGSQPASLLLEADLLVPKFWTPLATPTDDPTVCSSSPHRCRLGSSARTSVKKHMFCHRKSRHKSPNIDIFHPTSWSSPGVLSSCEA